MSGCNKLKILVCSHKDFPVADLDCLFPIRVGKLDCQNVGNIQTDSTIFGTKCDNIASKNDSYCELTAIYWAWKNIRKIYPDLKYIGLFHYRRYFDFNHRLLFEDSISYSTNEINDYSIDEDSLINLLDQGNVIVSKDITFPYHLKLQYSATQISNDYNILKDVIRDKYSEYFNDFVNYMEKNNKLSAYNMFIMSIEDFDEYCLWLFDLLAELEKVIPVNYYNQNQKRVFGYMAERLQNVWLIHNGKKLKKFNVCYFDKKTSSKPFIMRMFSHIKKEISANMLINTRN